MQNSCVEYVEKIYSHPKVTELIGKINPPQLRDDLRQEMALALLEYPCEKLALINQENKLVPFTKRLIWIMGTLPNSNFYKVYRKNNDTKLREYINCSLGNPIPVSFAKISEEYLAEKANRSVADKHEWIIFNQYIEMGSDRKVAAFFGIGRKHVNSVMEKVRNELKQNIQTWLSQQ